MVNHYAWLGYTKKKQILFKWCLNVNVAEFLSSLGKEQLISSQHCAGRPSNH